MIDTLKTKSPVWTTSSSVAPIPTVAPGGSTVIQDLHATGKRTLWVVTVLMAISALVFYVLSARAPLSKRLLHILVSISTTISFVIYMALATGQGVTYKHEAIPQVHKHVPNTIDHFFRQILWLRYVNWFITYPLVLVILSLLSGLPGAYLVIAIASDFVFLSAGVFGTFTNHSAVRWLWFVVSCAGYLTTVYHLGVNGTRAANDKEVQRKRFFGGIMGATLLVRVLYPIALAAGPLALKMSVDTETVLLAVLDIFTQGIFGYWIIMAHDSAVGSAFYLDGFWNRGVAGEGAIRIADDGA